MKVEIVGENFSHHGADQQATIGFRQEFPAGDFQR